MQTKKNYIFKASTSSTKILPDKLKANISNCSKLYLSLCCSGAVVTHGPVMRQMSIVKQISVVRQRSEVIERPIVRQKAVVTEVYRAAPPNSSYHCAPFMIYISLA